MRWRDLSLGLLLVAAVAHAEVTISDAWIRATAPGQTSAAAYLTLKSTEDAKVVAVTTPVAKSAGLHTTMNHAGVMHMEELHGLALPANRAVHLKPGGDHVMLMGIAKPLRAGEKVPLALTVEDARGQRTTLQVQARVTHIGAE